MGVGRIFSRRPPGDFSKLFLGRAKSGEICFFPIEAKKTTFFAEIVKIQEGQGPPAPLPTPMLTGGTGKREIHAQQTRRIRI